MDRRGFPSIAWAHLENPKSVAAAADSSLVSPISKSERKHTPILHKNEANFQMKINKELKMDKKFRESKNIHEKSMKA